jgi:hypothetical protein
MEQDGADTDQWPLQLPIEAPEQLDQMIDA